MKDKSCCGSYDIKEYNKAVSYYTRELKKAKGKDIMAVSYTDNFKAFLSYAALTRAADEAGKNINIFIIDGKSQSLECLENCYILYSELRKYRAAKKRNEKGLSKKFDISAVEALESFISAVCKKTKESYFEKLFQKPAILLEATESGFSGSLELKYCYSWFRKYKWSLLLKTSEVLWKQLYNLKKSEEVGIGFAAVPKRKGLDKPIEHFLDSYAISWAMKEKARMLCKKASMGCSNNKKSMLAKANKVSDLKATLLGCALTEAVEPVFKSFKKLAGFIGAEKLKPADASFFIVSKGYSGKHYFGEKIGYPSPDKKTRWQSPAGFIYQLDYAPQTLADKRKPMARFGFTETLPIQVFIETNNIDWLEMARKDKALVKIANRCKSFVVESSIKETKKAAKGKNGKRQKNEEERTSFVVELVKKNGENRFARGSDVDIRSKINKEFLKRTGKYAGCMANIPGGEMFVTPEKLKGTVIGDVVISIDQSYVLSEKSPFIIKADGNSYKVVSAPKKILEKFNKKKKEAWKSIIKAEKTGALPKKIIELKKKNFNRIGEFAINTNPKARLCDYLIVNEKIAGMIHVAMGSGFEADRATEYHTDVVINAKKQKLNIYGIEKKTGKKIWVMKKGRLVISY